MVKQLYDSDPEKAWLFRFDVLMIKRDHRRILNVQPKLDSYCFRCPENCVQFVINWKILNN